MKKGLIGVLLIALILIILVGYNSMNKEKIEFSYNVSVEDAEDYDYFIDHINESNSSIVKGNIVMLNQVFGRGSPCDYVDYNLSKKGNSILINQVERPEETTENPIGCIQVGVFDLVHLNLTLPKGDYKINSYPYSNKEEPMYSVKVKVD